MNWRTELERTLQDMEDELEVLVIKAQGRPMAPTAVPIDHPVFDREFDGGFGGSEGCHFTAWGGKYVYFPAVYDGSEWIDFVPPQPLPASHVPHRRRMTMAKYTICTLLAVSAVIGYNAFLIQRDAKLFDAAAHARACEQVKTFHPDCK